MLRLHRACEEEEQLADSDAELPALDASSIMEEALISKRAAREALIRAIIRVEPADAARIDRVMPVAGPQDARGRASVQSVGARLASVARHDPASPRPLEA